MSKDVLPFLQSTLEQMMESLTSGQTGISTLSIEANCRCQCSVDVEIRQPYKGSGFECSVSGIAIRGARESIRSSDPASLVKDVLNRLEFSIGRIGYVQVQLVNGPADGGTCLPSYIGNSEEGVLKIMPDSAKLLMESAVEQVIGAMAEGKYESTELRIHLEGQPQPLSIRFEACPDDGGEKKLLISLSPRQFKRPAIASELQAFILPYVSGALTLDSKLTAELQHTGPKGVLPAIKIVPHSKTPNPTEEDEAASAE